MGMGHWESGRVVGCVEKVEMVVRVGTGDVDLWDQVGRAG